MYCVNCVLFLLLVLSTSAKGDVHPKIAVIGAGVSGSSAAYYLSKMKDLGAEIDVYSKDPVGGRLSTVTIAGYDYETGGSILHPRNKYMKDFVDKFGLHKKKGISGKFGLYDGSNFVYREGNWVAVNLASLLWRYGLSILKINAIISDMLSKFERIYQLQDEGFVFSSISDLLSAMDPSFTDMLEHSLEESLKQQGISELFIQELATAVMRVNYGQSAEAHQFVGSVSLAGAESHLWSVHGGNKKVPIALLNSSGANFFPKEIESVELSAGGKFTLSTKDTNETRIYDAVILATPLTADTSPMKFVNFPVRLEFPGRFHRTVCTMVHGEINRNTFKFNGEDSTVDEIFTTNASLFFNSLSKNYPVDVDDGVDDIPSVWKVFSNNPLDEEQMKKLFLVTREIKVVDWKAYPEYDAGRSAGNFTLYPGLYHINTIEWAASAMEMGVIGARNVALLAADHFGVNIQGGGHNFHSEL